MLVCVCVCVCVCVLYVCLSVWGRVLLLRARCKVEMGGNNVKYCVLVSAMHPL